jgi:hypothetical protein
MSTDESFYTKFSFVSVVLGIAAAVHYQNSSPSSGQATIFVADHGTPYFMDNQL